MHCQPLQEKNQAKKHPLVDRFFRILGPGLNDKQRNWFYCIVEVEAVTSKAIYVRLLWNGKKRHRTQISRDGLRLEDMLGEPTDEEESLIKGRLQSKQKAIQNHVLVGHIFRILGPGLKAKQQKWLHCVVEVTEVTPLSFCVKSSWDGKTWERMQIAANGMRWEEIFVAPTEDELRLATALWPNKRGLKQTIGKKRGRDLRLLRTFVQQELKELTQVTSY